MNNKANFEQYLNEEIKKYKILEEKEHLDEGWKENLVAAAIAASSFLGSVKGKEVDERLVKRDTLTVPMSTAFKSGHYLIQNEDQREIYSKLELIGKYIQAHPKANFVISIQSSESQVTNVNADTTAIGTDKQGNKIYPKLERGELAKKRAEVARLTINTFLNDLRKNNILKGNVEVQDPQIIVGKTPYKQGVDNPKDEKYSKEQFVNIQISILSEKVVEQHKDVPEENKTVVGQPSNYVINIRGDEKNNAGLYYFMAKEQWEKITEELSPKSSNEGHDYGYADYDMHYKVFESKTSEEIRKNLGMPWRRIKNTGNPKTDVYQQEVAKK